MQGSKVETEILRFQREIEKSAHERSRLHDWERRKYNRSRSTNCSMDSLLSFDSDASSTYNSNCRTPIKNTAGLKMPPKGKFSSTTSLLTNVQKQILLRNEESWPQRNNRHNSSSPPPMLPPKAAESGSRKMIDAKDSGNDARKENKDSHKNSNTKRRVSISTDAVQIIGESSPNEPYNDPLQVNDAKNTSTVSSTGKVLDVNGESKSPELTANTMALETVSVPDVIPSHEVNNVACMRNKSKETIKPLRNGDINRIEDKTSKARLPYANNKDLEDLTEKGLPSVRDLVNKFMPNRTASVNLRHSPEPKLRQSLLQKVIIYNLILNRLNNNIVSKNCLVLIEIILL